jgi:hypothetical protein
MNKDKRINNDLQNTTQKTLDLTTQKTRSELRCSGRAGISCSSSDTHRVTLATNSVISHKFVNLSETKVISEIFLIYTKADDNAKIIHKIIEAKLNKNHNFFFGI